jgi:hypothetical protein
MNRIMTSAALAVPALLAASPLLAQSTTCLRYGWVGWSYTCVQWGSSSTTSRVPEIDASAGLLALAAVAAVVLFVRERRRAA